MALDQPLHTHTKPDYEPQINKIFKLSIKTHANDVHLKVGQAPKLRLYGELKNTTGEIMTQKRIEELVYELLNPAQKEYFLENGTLDFAHEIGNEHRFRINIFRQRGVISLVARRTSAYVPSFESLHLPTVIRDIAESRQGLVLVVGPTGSGKTTTIASMLDYITRTRSCHIITIEDPIEYLYKDNKAVVSQREIGIDVPDYKSALTYFLRQDPDVVFIGELRDSRTVSAGISASETGHVVFCTMHSANAAQAVHRILDLFPQEERELVRQALALNLRAVISQILLPSIKEDIDRIPAVEILLANPPVRKLISDGREADLSSVIRSSKQEGMLDMTDYLVDLIQKGLIDPKDAYKQAHNTEELKMALKGIRTTAEGIL